MRQQDNDKSATLKESGEKPPRTKTTRLSVNKETIKDLSHAEAKRIKGGIAKPETTCGIDNPQTRG